MESSQDQESQGHQESTELKEYTPLQESPEQQPSKSARSPVENKRRKKLARVVVVVAGVGLGLGIAAAYSGIQPFATYKDVVQERLAIFDDIPLSAPTDAYPRTRRFSGTYRTTVPVLGSEQTLTFKDNTLTVVDDFAGTFVYRYTVTMKSESEGLMELEDTDSAQVTQVPMHYIRDADCLVLYAQGRDKEGVTYCR
jgi:hypothetical protein